VVGVRSQDGCNRAELRRKIRMNEKDAH
jgi:hypothetical protein